MNDPSVTLGKEYGVPGGRRFQVVLVTPGEQSHIRYDVPVREPDGTWLRTRAEAKAEALRLWRRGL